MIPRKAFFDRVRGPLFRGALSQEQVDGCERILADAEANPWPDVRHLAYALATTFHETGRTMQPVEEIGRGAGRPYGRTPYWGRGLVQITWKANYERFEHLLGIPLVAEPSRACTWPVALPIMRLGMTRGLFTGRRLSDYFSPTRDAPVSARRVINGTDRADLVAEYHHGFMQALSGIRHP